MATAASVGTSRGAKRMRIVVLILVIAMLASLFSGLFFLYKDKSGSDRMVKALTLRIILAIAIFVILMGSYYFGLVPSQGL
jgi:uncharacterized SAM-binding protein YcdF (DUF218 family)